MAKQQGPLSRGELATWVRAMSGWQSLVTALDRRLRDDSDLSIGDYGVLSGIAGAPGSEIRMGDLADRVSFSLSRLSHVIERMSNNGWVERKPSDEDKRVRLLTLTTEGETVLDEAWPAHAQAIRELFLDQLTSEDRRTFEEAFGRIRKATRSEIE